MLDDFRDEEINTSSEFLDEFRQRLNSQPLDNIDDRRATVNRSQQIFLSTVLGIGLAGIVSWFIFSSDYSQTDNIEIPVVRRPQTAVKVQPTEPGGMEILNQDKTVYNIVEKKDADEHNVESLLPPPEEPQLPIIETADTSDTASTDVVAAAEKIITAQENKNNETKEEVAVQIAAPAPVVTASPAPAAVVAENKEAENKEAEIKVVENKPAAEKKPTAPANKEADIPTGRWQLQLMSTPNAAAVEKAWNSMKLKYSALKSLPHEVETADLGSKGIFYRLKAGAFIDRSDADKLCNSIKNSGGTCLVKKK